MSKPIIDISEHQSPASIDYKQLSRQISGVILRCGVSGYTSGKPMADKHFATHYQNFKNQGVPVGAYYFSVARTPEMARLEAQAVLDAIRGKDISLGVWIDTEAVERVGGTVNWQPRNYRATELTAVCNAFCEVISGAGYPAGIYANTDWYKAKLHIPELDQWMFWVAQWRPPKPDIGREITLWQYSSSE